MVKKPDPIDTTLTGEGFYSPADIATVLATSPTPCPDELVPTIEEMLENLAEWYFLSIEWSDKASASKTQKRFQAIEKCASALLVKLEVPVSGNPDDISFDILHPM